MSPRHHTTGVTASLHHCITALVSHLPCPLPPSKSVICLAPCHQTSQSFALPPTTTSPCHRVTVPVHHRVTVSRRHRFTASPHHRISQSFALPPATKPSQSFALPPATKPVSHLPCPLPPRHHLTASPRHRVTAPPCHRITVSLHHRVTASDFPHHMGMNLIG